MARVRGSAIFATSSGAGWQNRGRSRWNQYLWTEIAHLGQGRRLEYEKRLVRARVIEIQIGSVYCIDYSMGQAVANSNQAKRRPDGGRQETVYTVCDELVANACMHCAPMFIIEHRVGATPVANDPNATLTFIRFQGRTFGITCKHVVDSLQGRLKASGNRFSHTLFIALQERVIVQDRFVIPSGDWMLPAPDIAIRELRPDFPAYVGKSALDIEACAVPPLSEVAAGIAVGFPDRATEGRAEGTGYRLSMPCVHAVGENRSAEGPSFSLYSDLDSTPEIRDLSGMSGGPIYWSNEERYGLLGITYESAPLADALGGHASVHIKGQHVDLATIESWVDQVPSLFASK